MAGVTLSQPGNWTSWPPHEHAAMLEEVYLYIDMPAPAFGIQLVYTNAREPEVATIVREGDIVLMPQGYHPNVAAPGGSHQLPVDDGRPHARTTDRQFGVVNVQPDFAATPSGLDAAGRADERAAAAPGRRSLSSRRHGRARHRRVPRPRRRHGGRARRRRRRRRAARERTADRGTAARSRRPPAGRAVTLTGDLADARRADRLMTDAHRRVRAPRHPRQQRRDDPPRARRRGIATTTGTASSRSTSPASSACAAPPAAT